MSKYYLAAQLRLLALWLTVHTYNRWTELEKLWIVPVHLNTLLWRSTILPNSVYLLRPMSHLYTLWQKAHRQYSLMTGASLTTSFLFTPAVPDSLTAQMSSVWKTRDLFHYGSLVVPELGFCIHSRTIKKPIIFLSKLFTVICKSTIMPNE